MDFVLVNGLDDGEGGWSGDWSEFWSRFVLVSTWTNNNGVRWFAIFSTIGIRLN